MSEISLHFGGVVNTRAPEVLGIVEDVRAPKLAWLTKAENVDIGDSFEISQRPGYSLALAGNVHSGWSTPDESRAFFVEDSVLCEFVGGASVSLLALSTNADCAFVQVNGITVFSNGKDIGLIDPSEARLFTPPTEQFKLAMPPGNILAFFQGCLWVANGCTITRSDAYNIEQTDERTSTIPTDGVVSMMAAVGEPGRQGLWVSHGGRTSFIVGGDEAFAEKLPYGAVANTAVATDGAYFKAAKLSGDVVVWRSARGVCVGDGSGSVVNLSETDVAMKTGRRGAAMVRHRNGQVHYISTVQSTDDAFNPHG